MGPTCQRSSSADLSMHKCLPQLPSHRYLRCIAMGYLFCNTRRMGPGKGSRAQLFRELHCWGLGGKAGSDLQQPLGPFPRAHSCSLQEPTGISCSPGSGERTEVSAGWKRASSIVNTSLGFRNTGLAVLWLNTCAAGHH